MYTPIQLDKVRNFRYGMVAVDLIEGALKTNVARLDMENLTMKETAVIIWAGLAHEDKEITPEKVMKYIDDFSDIPTALGLMGEAFEKAFSGKNPKNA